MPMVLSLAYCLAAGLCESGGGYLVWAWRCKGKSVWLAMLDAVVLVLYSIMPTLHPRILARSTPPMVVS
jgi:small multidrug resistance family-3 protein